MVLYARVSQVRDDRTKSVDDQLAELRKWAQREGWHVVGEYRDDGVSASRYANGKTRPGWEHAMAAVNSGTAVALLVWELSRATRDRAVSVALETACAARGVRIGYGGHLHDPATADGEFSIGLEALLAARESAMTSERTRRAAESRAARGRPLAGVPYGYRRVLDPVTKVTLRRELHLEHAEIVREIVARLLARESANSIAADLNKRHVPAPASGRCTRDCGCRKANGRPDPTWEGQHKTVSGRWRGGNVSKIALRPSIAGIVTHRGEVLDVPASWQPLISVEDHHRLRALYASPERDRWRNPVGVRHLGSGIYRCGRCGGRMRVVPAVGDRPTAYCCRDCFRVSRSKEPVDAMVERLLIARLSQPDVLEALQSDPDANEERRKAAEHVAALRAEAADMRRLLREGRLSPVDIADWKSGWQPRLDAAEAAARPPTLPDAVRQVAGPDAAQRWAALSITDRRAVLDALLEVTIMPTDRRFQALDPSSVRVRWRLG